MEKATLKNKIDEYIELVAEQSNEGDYMRLKKLEIFLSNFIDYSYKDEDTKQKAPY
jgi:hypothetical protein